jgi:hypothetical protein
MQLDPATGLAEYPAAFVGTLVDVSGQIGVAFSSDADTVYRFEVEEWVKGDLGDFVDVHSAADGGACGIEVGIGNRAGVFLSVENGQLHSSLCSTIDADVLLAGAEPLVVGAPGPGILLASGNIGGYNYVVLNAEGGIVAGINGPFNEPFEQPWQFSVCPEDNVLVELWSRGLVVRDLTDLSIIRQVDLGEYTNTMSFSAMRCVSEDGSQILLAGEEWNGNNPTFSLFRVTDTVDVGAELPPGQVWLSDNFAVISDYDSGAVSVYDFDSAETTTLHEIAEKSEGDYISSAAISPDGATIVLAESRYDTATGTGMATTLFTYRPGGDMTERAEFTGEVWWIDWLDSGRMAVNGSAGESGSTSAIVFNPQLEVLFEIEGFQGSELAVINEKMYAVSGGTIVSADLADGSAWPLATLPTQFLGSIVALPADFNPSPDALSGNSDVNPPATVPPLISDEFGGGEAVDVTNTARIFLGVLVLGGVMALILNRRKAAAED